MNLSEKLMESLGRISSDEPTVPNNYIKDIWQFDIFKGFLNIPMNFAGVKTIKMSDNGLKNRPDVIKSIISYLNFDMKELSFKLGNKTVTKVDGIPVKDFISKITKIVDNNPDMETYDFVQAVRKEFK